MGVDYYPLSDTKLSFSYQYEENNIFSSYGIEYSYLQAKYNYNLSNDTYQVNLGVKFACDSIFDFSSCKEPKRIVPHLSELHIFENITFRTNMSLQTTNGQQF